MPADDDHALEGFTPARPICADESFHVATDLPRLRARYQAVNIKLDKTGGLTEALELEWRRHGIRVGDLMPPFVATPMVDSQRFTPPALRRLGVNLRAEDIALAVWRQVERPRVHRPIHWLFRLMYATGQVSPPSVSRLLMGWLSRD